MPIKYSRSAQRTLREPVAYRGPAAGGERSATVRISPAAPDTGIRFVRRDAPGGPQALRARIEYLGTDGSSATLECPGGIAVRAVGPLLAALAACGIDNAEVALDGPEAALPDGGTPALVEAIGRAAVQDQPRPLRVIRIERALDVEDGPRRAMLRPSSVPHAAISFGGEHERASPRWLALGLGEEVLRRELMNSAPDGEVRPTGSEGLRRALLDCVGYLAVAGAPIVGHFLAQNPDHDLMRRLVHAFLGQRGSWSLVEVPAARA